jgi:hypothetical protein
MTGGLLNIISWGNQNIILNGNPTTTFFKTKYQKYTNFGIQKYRLDFEGNRNLKLNEKSHFTFNVKRYGDLLMDTYVVLTLPDIWSGYYPKSDGTRDNFKPYHFNWIKHLGTNIIENINICSSSGAVLQSFSGDYIKNSLERNLGEGKKLHFHKMIGHENALYSPEDNEGNGGYYPNSIYELSEPSIRSRKIYVPIPFWYSNNSTSAFPLTCLQYDTLKINLTLRPINEMFTIKKNYNDDGSGSRRLSPNFVNENEQLYNFVQQIKTDVGDMDKNIVDWNSDVHIISSYVYLEDHEIKKFTDNENLYLIREVYEEKFYNIAGTNRIRINSNHLVSNWSWFLRRSDVKERNEWSNYTNFEYENIPNIVPTAISNFGMGLPSLNNINNIKKILLSVSITLDGKYRENEMDADIYSYIEKYSRCKGLSDECYYTYSFSLDTDHSVYQPSGALNMNKFKNILMDIKTIIPDKDLTHEVRTLCSNDGFVLGVIDADPSKLYIYTYDLTFFEERYNIIKIMSGVVGLVYSC